MKFEPGKEFPCIVCGKAADLKFMCIATGEHRCDSDECTRVALDYRQKKDAIMRIYSEEKRLLLIPLNDKLEHDLEMLASEMLYYIPAHAMKVRKE
jgi:hypothetical protein